MDSSGHATGTSIAARTSQPEQVDMLYENILRRLQAEIDEKIELAVREQLKKMAQMQAQMAL